MFVKKSITIIFFWFGLLLLPIMASSSDTYQAQVPVTDQSALVRTQALPQALLQVLIKLIGHSDIGQQPVIKAALPQAAQWLAAYSYTTIPILDQTQPQIFLQVQFASRPINQLLQDAHQVLWANPHPTLLVWLALTQQGQSTIVAADNAVDVQQYLNFLANQRGIPLLFPSLDLPDLNALSAADVVNANIATVQAASTRYQSDGILVGELANVATGQWQIKWQLVLPQKTINIQELGVTRAEVLSRSFNQIADKLAEDFVVATPNNTGNKVRLIVTDVHNVNNYNAVLNYLKKLPAIRDLTLVQFADTTLTFDLQLTNDTTNLSEALSMDHAMLPLDNQTTHLNYRWVS